MFNEATGQQQLWRIDFHLRKYGRPVEDHGVIASESDAEEDDREGGEGHGELGGGEGLLQRLVGPRYARDKSHQWWPAFWD